MSKQPENEQTILSGITLLLVEDEIELNRMYINSLEYHGATIIAVHDGVQALHTLKHHFVDIILLDLMMPRMNGYETLKEIRKEKKYDNIPVIILTNLQQDKTDDILALEKFGISELLFKCDTSRTELVSKILTYTQ